MHIYAPVMRLFLHNYAQVDRSDISQALKYYGSGEEHVKERYSNRITWCYLFSQEGLYYKKCWKTTSFQSKVKLFQKIFLSFDCDIMESTGFEYL